MWDLSSPTRDRTSISCIVRWILENWITREVPLPQFLIYHASISSRNISSTLKLGCPMGLVIWYLRHRFAVKIKWLNTSKVLRTVPGTWLCGFLSAHLNKNRTLSFTPGFLKTVVFKFSWPLLPVKIYFISWPRTPKYLHIYLSEKKVSQTKLNSTQCNGLWYISFHSISFSCNEISWRRPH